MTHSDLDQNAFLAACLTEANQLKADVDPLSVLKTALHAAIVGLIPGSALGHCYFVPFKGQCQLIIGYKGYRELAFLSGYIANLYMDVVCQGDDFEHWIDESGPKIIHRPKLDRNASKENIIASYCVWKTARGGHGVQVVPRSELNKVDKGRDVWRSDYPSMAKKTSIMRASKVWPQDRRLAFAVMAGEQAERDEQQALPGDELDNVTAVDAGVDLESLV